MCAYEYVCPRAFVYVLHVCVSCCVIVRLYVISQVYTYLRECVQCAEFYSAYIWWILRFSPFLLGTFKNAVEQ